MCSHRKSDVLRFLFDRLVQDACNQAKFENIIVPSSKQGGNLAMKERAIEVSNLKKYFKDVKAVDDISFSVEQGELFGFLGVNGAGKSTVINILCTLYKKDGGSVRVLGNEVGKDDEKIRQDIGMVHQENSLDELLTVKENLQIRGGLYGETKENLRKNFDKVVKLLGLKDVLNRPYGKLSGGQKRRAEIAAALMHEPKILFLDEPTTGLDPATRKNVWEANFQNTCMPESWFDWV